MVSCGNPTCCNLIHTNDVNKCDWVALGVCVCGPICHAEMYERPYLEAEQETRVMHLPIFKCRFCNTPIAPGREVCNRTLCQERSKGHEQYHLPFRLDPG